MSSVLLAAYNNVNAQTLESITQQRKYVGNSPGIKVGSYPVDMKINVVTNKIYVANSLDNSVTIIDSNSGISKSIHVGTGPESIAIDGDKNLVYVANRGSSSVSVIA